MKKRLCMYSEIGPNISATESRFIAISEGGVRIGEDVPTVRWTDGEVESVRLLREAGMSYGEISKKMEIPKSTVYAICCGKLRAAYPKTWKKVQITED